MMVIIHSPAITLARWSSRPAQACPQVIPHVIIPDISAWHVPRSPVNQSRCQRELILRYRVRVYVHVHMYSDVHTPCHTHHIHVYTYTYRCIVDLLYVCVQISELGIAFGGLELQPYSTSALPPEEGTTTISQQVNIVQVVCVTHSAGCGRTVCDTVQVVAGLCLFLHMCNS